MRVVALDMEGVVTPEIWVAVADHTGVDDLRITTRDEPDYQKLMDYRIATLERHDIDLPTICKVIDTLEPLPGAREFLDELRSRYQLVLLSDTFEEFARHLVPKLGRPHLLCHRLTVVENRITSFVPRIAHPKQRAVEAYQGLGYHVSAMGDSFNDLEMLAVADAARLFRASDELVADHPEMGHETTYAGALAWLATFDDPSI